MANRTSFKSSVTTKIQPLMTTLIHRDVLNNDLADSVVFGEDVAVVQNSGATNITVDFTGKDRVDLTRTGGALNITLSGIGDGERKFLLITKTIGQEITFVGVTDITPIKANVTAESIVLYEIVRKSSYYFCKAWVENVKTATDEIEGVLETATQAESDALSVTDKIVTPGRQPLATQTQKGLVELATATEARALTDLTVAIAPGTIPIATTVQKGVIEVATSSQVDAGTAGDLAVIASDLKRKYDALVASIAAKTSKGSLTVGDINTGKYNYTITHNAGTTDYNAIIGLRTLNNSSLSTDYGLRAPRIISKSANSMVIGIQKLNDANVALYLDWVLIF